MKPKHKTGEAGFFAVETGLLAGLLACLIVLYALFFYACFKTLVIFGEMLKEHDDNLDAHKDDLGKGKNSKSDGEPKNAACEPSQLDCLLHEPVRLLHQIFRMVNKRFRLLRKFLRGIGCALGNPNIKRNSGKIKRLGGIESPNKVNKFLKLSRGGVKKKFFNLFTIIGSCKISSFFGRHKTDAVHQSADAKNHTASSGERRVR